MLSKLKATINLLRNGVLQIKKTTQPDEESHADLKLASAIIRCDQRRNDKNEEDVTIVFLNKNTNYVQETSFIQTLRNINDYVQVFEEEEGMLAFIESVTDEKVLLIVDYISDDLLKSIDILKQVDTAVCFMSQTCVNLPSHITFICSTENQLIDDMRTIRHQVKNQMSVFSIYNQTKTKKFDLTQESGSFLFFQLFKAAFKKLPKNSESKKLMLAKYRNYYSGNEKILEEMVNFEHKYKSKEALRWYVNDSFLYRLINKALRIGNIHALCYFHFYINDLSNQIEKEYIEFKKRNSKCCVQFYRGFRATRERIKHYEDNIGNLMLTNGYLSTTSRRQLAYDFAMKQNIRSDEEKLLIEFTVDLTLVKSVIFADISRYNIPSDENEIIFDLGTAFKINSCKFNVKENLWLLNAIATDEGVDVASEYIEYQAAKMTDSNIILTFGNLIIDIGDYDKAEKYFDSILSSSIPNDEEIACIYYNIGRVYRLKGEYQRALDFLNQAYITHAEARPSRLVSAAKTMNAIGIVYMEQNHVQQAIDSFECALKLYAKSLDQYHPDIGGTLINLGNIYCEQEQLEHALGCFKRAQNIYELHLPLNHPNRAILLNNLGNLYYQQHQWDLALSAYQQALEINEVILPFNHPDLTKTRHNISMVQHLVANPNDIDVKFTQAPQYNEVIARSHVDALQINPFPTDVIHIDQTSESKAEFIEMKKY